MKDNYYIYVAIMAGVTYLIRVLPLVLIRREIKNVFLRSFLYYVPYVTLAAMTFPAILSETASIWSASAGLLIGVVLAFKRQSLFKVSFFACLAVFAVELLFNLQ